MINMDLEKISLDLLSELEKSPHNFRNLSEKIPGVNIDLIKNLEGIGFIKREGDSKLISSCNWGLTEEGKSFLKFNKLVESQKESNYKIILTLPPKFKEYILNKHKNIILTEDAIKETFSNSKETLRILSPYVDASVIDYLKIIDHNVKIQFLTVPSRYGNNPVLERLKQSMKNLEVKYMFESKDEIQQFQIHAKVIISDDKSIYIGSANFRDTSILYNLESGIISNDEGLIQEYISIYDDIYSL
jgi:DNA-binding HxlR family transcriptional regulator